MMKKKTQIILTCAISTLFLVLLFFLFSASAREKTYSVFLLDEDVKSGCMVTAEMVHAVAVPKSCILRGACKDIREIEGKYAESDMEEGELVSYSDLREASHGITYPLASPDHVCYTLALEASNANGWWIARGNETFLYLYDGSIQKNNYEDPSGMQGIAEENPVQVIGPVKIIRIMTGTGEEISQDGQVPDLVCLELTKEQAQTLFCAENSKKIKMVAENTTDMNQEKGE